MARLDGGKNFLDQDKSTDQVRWYLQEIGKVPLLTHEQEIMHGAHIQAGLVAQSRIDQLKQEIKSGALLKTGEIEAELKFLARFVYRGSRAQDAMIEANLRLVVNIAKKYQGRRVEFLDLVQEGTIGLARATEKFDGTKGWKFSTYAYWWIRQGITRAIAQKSRTVRLPVHVTEKVNQLKKVTYQLAQELKRSPTTREVAKGYLSLNPRSIKDTSIRDAVIAFQKGADEGYCVAIIAEAITELRSHNRDPLSLNRVVGNSEDTELGALLPSEVNIEANLEAEFTREQIRNRVGEVLDGRERDVIVLRFGLTDGIPRSLTEVGKLYNISKERVRQIEYKALKRLRPRLRQFQSAI